MSRRFGALSRLSPGLAAAPPTELADARSSRSVVTVCTCRKTLPNATEVREKRATPLYSRGNTACPICLRDFTRDEAYWGRTVTLEHVPNKALGGRARCLTCEDCNSQAGRTIDQAAAMTARNRFGDTVDLLGKRDTFMRSRDGKPLTPPFAGYSSQDMRDLHDSESRSFTMSIKIPHPRAVAASSLKSGYLAVFSLLGAPGGTPMPRVLPSRRPGDGSCNHSITTTSASTAYRHPTTFPLQTSCSRVNP